MWINSSIKNPSWCHRYVLKQTDLDGFLFNAEFCLICTRVTLTGTQNPCPKHPWHLGFVAGSFLLCPKSCPSCCWMREPIPEPLNQGRTSPLYFPGWIWGPAPSRCPHCSCGSGVWILTWAQEQEKSLPYSELLPRLCKNPQTSKFLPLSHLLLSVLPSPHSCSKKQTQRGENLPQNSKISFKQAKNLSPFIIPLQPVMQHFHPLKPLFFSLLFVFFVRNFQMPV